MLSPNLRELKKKYDMCEFYLFGFFSELKKYIKCVYPLKTSKERKRFVSGNINAFDSGEEYLKINRRMLLNLISRPSAVIANVIIVQKLFSRTTLTRRVDNSIRTIC
jgi:hypothetical protein